MKIVRIILTSILIIVLIGAASAYVYIGTYVLPIAPRWVTQLPPNPPKPKIKHKEFSFKLEYEINGEKKTVEDSLICDFDGFEVRAVGGPKKRIWKEHFKNKQNDEILTTGNKSSTKEQIVLENIDIYKVVLSAGTAEYFLGEPEYGRTEKLPFIQVYDTTTEYYKDPTESNAFLSEYAFKIIEWYCDTPLESNFK